METDTLRQDATASGGGAIEGPACPRYGAHSAADTLHCPVCGAPLLRECAACGKANPLDAQVCSSCGQQLAILDTMFDRLTATRGKLLSQLQREAPAVKARAEEASTSRLQQMWQEEAEGRDELQQALRERERQQRLLMALAITILALAAVMGAITLALR